MATLMVTFFSSKQTWKPPKVHKLNNSKNSCPQRECNLSHSVTPDEKASSLHTTYSRAKRLRAAAAVMSGKRSLVNHSEPRANSRAVLGQTVYTCCCDRYRAGPMLQNKQVNEWIKRKCSEYIGPSPREGNSKVLSILPRARAITRMEALTKTKKKTLAGGVHTFI